MSDASQKLQVNQSYISQVCTIKTQMNIEPFCFGVVRAVLNISAYFAKVFYFLCFFLNFHGQNKHKIDLSVHSKVRRKKLINIKMRKPSILVHCLESK